MSGSSTGTRPRRRDAERTRRAILDVAQRQLAELGPDGIRLTRIAAEVGISHPAILHHFGSREGLMEALVREVLDGQSERLLRALEGREPGVDTEAILERVAETLGHRGHARLLAWLSLAGRDRGRDPEPNPTLLRIAEVLDSRRSAAAPRSQATGDRDPEDTVFAVLLVAAALVGEAVMGEGLLRSAGLGDDPEAPSRFRAWLGRLVAEHLDSRDPGRPRSRG